MSAMKDYIDEVQAIHDKANHLERLLDDYVAMIDVFYFHEPRISGDNMLFQVRTYEDFMEISEAITTTWGENLAYKMVIDSAFGGPLFVWTIPMKVHVWIQCKPDEHEAWMYVGNALVKGTQSKLEYKIV